MVEENKYYENNSLNYMQRIFNLRQFDKPELKAEEDIKDNLKYKERIVFATMKANIPNWEKPNNWDKLPVNERLKRLNSIEANIN